MLDERVKFLVRDVQSLQQKHDDEISQAIDQYRQFKDQLKDKKREAALKTKELEAVQTQNESI